MMARSLRFLVPFIICVALLIVGSQCKSSLNLKLVMVAHRHGARTPLNLVNNSMCNRMPPYNGCGFLTPQGFDMLHSLGETLRGWYNDILPSSYDPSRIFTRTTSVPRTCQSADAMLRGMFSNLSSFFPVLENLPLDRDYMLHPTTSPTMLVYRNATAVATNKTMAEKVLSLLDVRTLTKIGKEIDQESVCPSDVVKCALLAQDVGAYWLSNGVLDKYPATASAYSTLNEILVFYNHLRFFYDRLNKFSVGYGSPGILLAEELYNQAAAVTNGTQKYLFREYSAHDSSLMPLYVTLGNENATGHGLRPVFAEAIVFEVHQNRNSTVYIRAYAGFPTQTPGAHNYFFQPYTLRCMGPNGVYTKSPSRQSTDPGCPIEDWKRFIFVTAPEEPGSGYCFRYPPQQKDACPSVDKDVTSAFPLCKKFREQCPETSCPDGQGLDYQKSMACKKFPASLKGGEVLGIVLGCLGALIGLVGAVLGIVCSYRAKSSSKTPLLNS